METGKKIREIEIEFERVRIVSNLKRSKINCENCSSEAEFITLSSALQIFETNEPMIAQLAKEKILHLRLGIGNELLICLPSLLLAQDFF